MKLFGDPGKPEASLGQEGAQPCLHHPTSFSRSPETHCVEYNVLYVYHAMFAYFNRDNVALKGLAK
ncbi:hypothetical protein JHK85_028609 [Glycine max]|nr:hypothetical protein JHK85_028609 [Glycine max]